MRFIVAAFAVALSTLPASAVDFNQQLYQLDGKPFPGPDGKPVELTLAAVSENALLLSYQDEPNLSGEEKVKRYALALKIKKSVDDKKEPELSADEVALIKRLIAKSYNPLVTGESWKILDPASVPKP